MNGPGASGRAQRLERVRALEHFALERLPALQLSDGSLLPAGLGRGRPQARGPLAALHADRPDRAAARRGARLRALAAYRRDPRPDRVRALLGGADAGGPGAGAVGGLADGGELGRQPGHRPAPLPGGIVRGSARLRAWRSPGSSPAWSRRACGSISAQGEELLGCGPLPAPGAPPGGPPDRPCRPRPPPPPAALRRSDLQPAGALPAGAGPGGRRGPGGGAGAGEEDRRAADAERRLAVDLRSAAGDRGRALRALLDPPGLDGDDGPPQPQPGERGSLLPRGRAARARLELRRERA